MQSAALSAAPLPQIKVYDSGTNTWVALGSPLGGVLTYSTSELGPALALALGPGAQPFLAYTCGQVADRTVCAASGASIFGALAPLPPATDFQSASLALAVGDNGVPVLAFRILDGLNRPRLGVFWFPLGASQWEPYAGDAASAAVSDNAVRPCVSLTMLMGTQPVVGYHDVATGHVEVKRNFAGTWVLVGDGPLTTTLDAENCPSIDAYTQSEVSPGTGPVTFTVTHGVWAAYKDSQPTGLEVRSWDMDNAAPGSSGAWSPAGQLRAAANVAVTSFSLATERDNRHLGPLYYGTKTPCVAYTDAGPVGYLDCMRNTDANPQVDMFCACRWVSRIHACAVACLRCPTRSSCRLLPAAG